MKISVAICTYNREKYLPQLFDSIVHQDLDRTLFEVILVNNNSPGNTKELFEQFKAKNPDIVVIYKEEHQQGLSFSRNNAIETAQFELITFLDDDAFIDSKYLSELMRVFQQGDVTAIGGKILLHYETKVPKWENPYLNSLLGYFNKGDVAFDFNRHDYPRGSNMAFRTHIFKEIGSFNIALGRIGSQLIGGEEKDLFNRIYQKKYRVVYAPHAIVYHSVPIERTKSSFIKQQARGTGCSERVRCLNVSVFNYLKRIGIEVLKWGASILLAVLYLIQLKFAKAYMILFFRFWVTLGLLYK